MQILLRSMQRRGAAIQAGVRVRVQFRTVMGDDDHHHGERLDWVVVLRLFSCWTSNYVSRDGHVSEDDVPMV
ncbi:hypothetical protein ACMD2_23856 [Ananas comosus]|uniref:Uncharacterized protein n=1 Tax=Ananas comosus TaxID=4615 RepID=A0A199V1Z2_ANACO|nr:hypothetical protein ACMD2_23856 [Ananas comosus]